MRFRARLHLHPSPSFPLFFSSNPLTSYGRSVKLLKGLVFACLSQQRKVQLQDRTQTSTLTEAKQKSEDFAKGFYCANKATAQWLNLSMSLRPTGQMGLTQAVEREDQVDLNTSGGSGTLQHHRPQESSPEVTKWALKMLKRIYCIGHYDPPENSKLISVKQKTAAKGVFCPFLATGLIIPFLLFF